MLYVSVRKAQKTQNTIAGQYNSKAYERVMFKQIGDFMEEYFSKFQCGFRNSYSTQQCPIALIEK